MVVPTLTVLMMEDSPDDADLTIEVLKEVKMALDIHVAEDGVEGLRFLRKEGSYKYAPRPDVILLDLNMPRKNGREVLAEIKADEDLRKIPVVVLTTSASIEDIEVVYDLHANCFITKPVDLDQFMKVVKSIEEFWLTIVKLPPK